MGGESEIVSQSKPHAIVFAYPFQGHITPTTNLSLKLASHGFTITYIQIQFIHHTISKAHNSDSGPFVEARKSGLDMRYATISDGFPLDFDRTLNLCEYWESMMLDFPGRVDEMVGEIIKSNPPSTPFFLLADSMYTWPSDIATKHKLVHVSLWTGSAATFSINYNLDFGHDKILETQEADAVNLLMRKVVTNAFNQVKKADVILCNTVQQLECDTLLALNQKQPTYAIGPINLFTEILKTKLKNGLFSESDCSKWLDSKPPASVIYISFGSIYSNAINKQEITEIAHGLIISEVNFIWVHSGQNDDAFPIEFLGHVKDDRGLIIPWCDQNMVLSNPSIMGFVTHCGWNSTLESIWNGVPMICRPISVDQPMNRKLVVEDWKVGIDLCDDGKVITREEVACKIKSLMMGKRCVELRQEMKKKRELLRNALDEDGSSQINFNQFVEELKARLYGANLDETN